MYNCEEKRRSARARTSMCAWVSFPDTEEVYCTLTVDVSHDGAQLSTLRPVNVGERLALLIQLYGGDVECCGEVCWSSTLASGPCAFGVRFLDLSAGARGQLERFVSPTMPQLVAGPSAW